MKIKKETIVLAENDISKKDDIITAEWEYLKDVETRQRKTKSGKVVTKTKTKEYHITKDGRRYLYLPEKIFVKDSRYYLIKTETKDNKIISEYKMEDMNV